MHAYHYLLSLICTFVSLASPADVLKGDNTKSLWSAEKYGTYISTPPHGTCYFGGSSNASIEDYVPLVYARNDVRRQVSSWGGCENQIGGCCSSSPDDEFAGWGQNFTIRVMRGSPDPPDCLFRADVRKYGPPSLTCPSDVTLNTSTGQTTAVMDFNVTASDSVWGVPFDVSCYPSSGSAFSLGITQVTCRSTVPGLWMQVAANDGSANFSNATFVNGLNSNVSSSWVTACSEFASLGSDWILRVNMGAVVDYFEAPSGSSLCGRLDD